jgi:hypothetical protein
MYSNPGTQRWNIIVHKVVELEIVVCTALAVVQRRRIAANVRRQWTVRLVAENRHPSMGPKQSYWMPPPMLSLALPCRAQAVKTSGGFQKQGNGVSWQILQHPILSYHSVQRDPRELRILIGKIVSASAEYTNDQMRTRHVFALTCTTVPEQAPDGEDDEYSSTKR